MEEKKQKVGQIRKKEILDAAKRVFLRKGFADTVMEDIITETSLSRGGVYYHYKNKVEILHDLMREGIAYRVEKINEFIVDHSGELDTNAVAQMIIDKMLDESDLMSVYVIYLQAKKNNQELRNLFPILVEESLKAAYTGIKGAKESDCIYLTNDFLIFFMNTIMLGCEILDGARDSFTNNREFFIEIVDWRIGLSIFVPLPIAFIGMATMMYKYRSRMAVWLSSYANVADRSAEYVRGIPVIKAFAQDKVSYGKFADAVKFYHFSTMKWWKQSWFGKALMTAAMMTPQIVSMPLAFYLYGQGEIGIETLLLSLILPIAILPQAFAIMMSFELFQMASNTWVSIQELLDMPAQKRPDAENKAAIDKNQGIKFDKISFSYHDGTEVLHNISFETRLGEVTALVGPSGGGKSTIAKLLAGFWDQSSGMISIGGADTKNISFKQLAEEISFVSQDNFLFDVSIRYNIRLGKPDAAEDEIIAAAKAAHCHDFIMALPDGYDTKAGEAGGAMSGGERQRITLARAILKPASTIVLDEATAYADPENEALIQEAIFRGGVGYGVYKIIIQISRTV